MKSVHVTISGVVQGVGFRVFIEQQAQKYHITGWVRNTHDNKVEAVFVGEEESVNNIIKDCKLGSYASEVHDVIVEDYTQEKQFNEFTIS